MAKLWKRGVSLLLAAAVMLMAGACNNRGPAAAEKVQEAVLLPALALSMNTGGRSPRKHWNFLPIVAWRIL